MGTPLIEVIAVTYKQPGPLAVLVQCFLNQTADNWKLSVWHDGPDAEFDAQMRAFEKSAGGKITHRHTDQRFNDWGHSLREQAIRDATGDYLLLTNGDNYYVPAFIRMLNSMTASEPDIVIFDMIHSYGFNVGQRLIPPYSAFDTALERNRIDIGAAIVRTALAKQVGFRDHRQDGDATYFEDLQKLRPLKVAKLPLLLFVHN